ncbi:MAG: putative DNA-binding domain-containing protein [Alphaproteobacteria bacterium]|nr:putative DNA-binding domain-containing protein [Alphaproteobacteria bacterium]MCB9930131.1 putative DNA-binding domain-containing protein [Alphaproteobacteria bacterium]
MPTLREIQDAFRAGLLAPDAAAAGTAAAAAILPDGLDAAQRLQIHRNHVFTTLGDALAGVYAAVAAMVGAEFFRAMAQRFVTAAPPTEPVLYAYGAGFADFIAGFPPAAGLAYLPDLARLEWALHASFHAPDAPTLQAADLGALPPEALPRQTLRLRADARLVRSSWPVADLWQAVRSGDADAVGSVDLDAGPVHLLVLRQAGDARLWALPAGEWHWLSACAGGQGLAAAAEVALTVDPAFDLTAALTRNLQRGTFAPLSADPADPEPLRNRQ